MNILALTQKLISFTTVNPPGDEAPMAEFIGRFLINKGFDVKYFNFGENRVHVIAEKGNIKNGKPLVFSGHLDTVPLAGQTWKFEPFSGKISGDKVYGRGSSDMKSGLAAMLIAAVEVPENQFPKDGIRLIFSAGEELGCQGIQNLTDTCNSLGNASAIVVGEPTGNVPAIGHKGAIYLNAVTKGKTAHSSMPNLGINAIYKAARSVSKIEAFRYNAEKDVLLGFPTINVGKISGGMNINSVPDHAEFTIDMRTTSSVNHEKILKKLGHDLGQETIIEKLVDLSPVSTDEKDPFVQLAYRICSAEGVKGPLPRALPYVTDGSVLQKYYNMVPTIILGPGQPEMAHQTNEFCYISKMEQAVSIYKNIIINWRYQL